MQSPFSSFREAPGLRQSFKWARTAELGLGSSITPDPSRPTSPTVPAAPASPRSGVELPAEAPLLAGALAVQLPSRFLDAQPRQPPRPSWNDALFNAALEAVREESGDLNAMDGLSPEALRLQMGAAADVPVRSVGSPHPPWAPAACLRTAPGRPHWQTPAAQWHQHSTQRSQAWRAAQSRCLAPGRA